MCDFRWLSISKTWDTYQQLFTEWVVMCKCQTSLSVVHARREPRTFLCGDFFANDCCLSREATTEQHQAAGVKFFYQISSQCCLFSNSSVLPVVRPLAVRVGFPHLWVTHLFNGGVVDCRTRGEAAVKQVLFSNICCHTLKKWKKTFISHQDF